MLIRLLLVLNWIAHKAASTHHQSWRPVPGMVVTGTTCSSTGGFSSSTGVGAGAEAAAAVAAAGTGAAVRSSAFGSAGLSERAGRGAAAVAPSAGGGLSSAGVRRLLSRRLLRRCLAGL